MRWISSRPVSIAALFLVLAAVAFAQQPIPPKKRVPVLTTEDIIREKAQQTTVEVTPEGTPAAPATEPAAPKPPGEEKVTPEEAAWRENVKQARAKAKQTERAAEEAELQVTELRNRLNTSGQTTQQRNQAASDLEDAGRQLAELRRAALAAADDLTKLLEYGREKRFSEAAEPKPAEGDEKGNEEHFRRRYQELAEKLESASRRVQLYENRIRELNARMQNNAGSGDNFFLGQLQQEKDAAQLKLDEAREAYQKAQDDIEALRQEARRAGVPPGVFR